MGLESPEEIRREVEPPKSTPHSPLILFPSSIFHKKLICTNMQGRKSPAGYREFPGAPSIQTSLRRPLPQTKNNSHFNCLISKLNNEKW